MRTKIEFLLSICFFVLIESSVAQEVIQFRGEQSKGYYQCTNLLDVWPEKGPTLIWEAKGIGNGYGSPAITEKGIFVNGEIDSVSYLYSLDHSGAIKWKQPIGKEWVVTYPGSRSTPTVIGDLVYVTAGYGDVACFTASDGTLKWKRNLLEECSGVNTRFGLAESITSHGDRIFFMPGGAEKNVVALNRFTGEEEWACAGMGEMPSFCTPLVLELTDRTLLITFSKSHLLGIDANTGELLWTHKQDTQGDVHVNTPLYENGFIYYITGDGNGTVKLELSADGKEIKEIYRNKQCDNTMGGFIKKDDFIYTSSYEKRCYYVFNAEIGQVVDSVKFDRGVTICADNKLYLYNERGKLGLFSFDNEKVNKISEFKVTLGSKAHYAHPVICKGVLYVRRGDSLMAYDILKKE